MAFAAVDSAASAVVLSDGPLQLDSIPTVDIRVLSQSELYSLSFCSPSAFDSRRCDDIVIPKIDRSVFNESAGSRKQTYSRLRLAPAASSITLASPSSSIHRRTPHLRFANPSPFSSALSTDPERAENSQIIHLLKQLFAVDTNSHELFQIRVDYSDSVPQLPNVATIGQKRKRGRPRKNPSPMVVALPVEVKPESTGGGGVGVEDGGLMNKDLEEREREIVNKDGVAVDLVALGSMEDPYGAELRRRTEGLGSEEELLRFLEALNGQWGSRRKKKRLVDASELGNMLPKGWKISLSLKRKAGRVWLHCRRYISPNGRQFVSCKEVSSYLLSLRGVPSGIQLGGAQNIGSCAAAEKMASSHAETVLDDINKENNVCHTQTPAVTSISGGHGIHVMLRFANLPEVQKGETLHCDKCNLAFNKKDDLLQHQLSSHRRKRSKSSQSIADGVIIKEGQYECPFCHMTFSELHSCNGHIAAHVGNQVKSADEHSTISAGDGVHRISSGFPQRESAREASNGSDSKTAAEVGDVNVNNNFNSSLHYNFGHQVNLLSNNNERKDAMDLETVCLDSEVVVAKNESNSYSEVLGSACVHTDAQEKSSLPSNSETKDVMDLDTAHLVSEVIMSKNESNSCSEALGNACADTDELERSSVPSNNSLTNIRNNVFAVSSEQEAASESVRLGFDGNDEICDTDMKEGQHVSATDNLNFDDNKLADDLVSGRCNNNNGLEDSLTAVNKDSVLRASSWAIDNTDNVVLLSKLTFSGETKDLDSSLISSSKDVEGYDQVYGNGIFPGSMDEQDHDGISNSRIKENSASNKDDLTNIEEQEQQHFGSCLVVRSPNETINVTEKFCKKASTCLPEELGQQQSSESNLLALSGDGGTFAVQNYDVMSTSKMEDLNVDDFQNFGSAELVHSFSSNHNALNGDASCGTKDDRNLGLSSLFPPSGEQKLEDGLVMPYQIPADKHKEESASVLINESSVTELSNAYAENKIYTLRREDLKCKDVGNSRDHELSLAFGNSCTELGGNGGGILQERHPPDSSNIQSAIDKKYGVQCNFVNSNWMEDPNRGLAFELGLRDSSLGGKNSAFENNFNMVFPNRGWEEPRVDGVESSDNKFMTAFGKSQPAEDVMAGSIWRSNEENIMRHGLGETSNSEMQTLSCFRTFDVISDKGEGLSGVDGKYESNTAFEELRPGRSEPVEYSFMTMQSSNSLPGDAKVFSYDTGMGQGFDSSFWLRKDHQVPNAADGNHITTTCVWCRSEFYQDSVQSGMQAGTIGSVCPTCSTRISQQFNVS